jgi:hypothetical protein
LRLVCFITRGVAVGLLPAFIGQQGLLPKSLRAISPFAELLLGALRGRLPPLLLGELHMTYSLR